MDLVGWLRKHLEAADTDLLREMVLGFVQALMGAEADALCGAPLGQRSADRVNQRNGYRERRLDTRVGTLELAIPKLRQGGYFPDWLLEPRRRGERALVAVVAECDVRGVATRRVEGLVQTLGITSLSKSQVSELAKTLDSEVAAFRTRPLDARPVCLRLGGRAGGQVPRGRPDRQCRLCSRDRRQCRRPSGDPRGGCAHQRGRCWLDGVPA
jgi:putative transposase